MQFHTIITHEHPDLDAMLCCYLLKKYGVKRYPGINDADIAFVPAGRLPDGKNPAELEEEGVLAVDIGGGRLDTHPDDSNQLEEEKKELSAANLVARDLNVHSAETLVNLLEFARLHDSAGRSLASKNPIDHLVALPNLIRGGALFFDDSFEKLTLFFAEVFRAIEMAESVCKNDILTKKSDFMVGIDGKRGFLPSQPNLKGFLASYIYQRYITPDVVWQFSSPPLSARIWDDFSDFASDYEISRYPELGKLVTLVERISPGSYLLDSTRPIDETVSIANIINGFWQLHKEDLAVAIKKVFTMFDCAAAYEKNWFDAIAEYEQKRQLHEVGKIKVAGIVAERGAVAKVARWRDKADITVFQDQRRRHISISINRLGRMRNWSFKRLAARIRTAEMTFNPDIESQQIENVFEIGEVCNWFLHQSEKLLLHGSPKANRAPSLVPFHLVVDLVLTEIDRARKLAVEFCPPNTCLYSNCLFFSLRLANCFEHRRNIRDVLGEGDLSSS